MCTDCDNQPNNNDSEDDLFWWLVGVVILTLALLLSARMGIYQEKLYKEHGKHPYEALYYTVSSNVVFTSDKVRMFVCLFQHLLSLPAFIFYYPSIVESIQLFNESEPILVPFLKVSLPYLWLHLIGNIITQYLCISSVYILTTECTSLTVTLVVTLRKFLSLIFSIVYFKNPFTVEHWFGTALVFLGTLLFTEVINTDFLSPKKQKSA